MCEEESNSFSQTDFGKHLSEITLEEGISSSMSNHELKVSDLQSSPASSNTCILRASCAEVAALTSCCGLEERCSCISATYPRGMNPDMSTAVTLRHQFCGWEQRMLPSASSSHIIVAQNTDQHLESTSRESSKSTASLTKSKLSFSNQPISYNKRTDSSKSQIRSCYVQSDKTFLYEFEHHVESASSLDIDKYRKTITYPKMEKTSVVCDGPADVTLSGRCGIQSSSVIKPKLFVLGKAPATVYTKPFTYVKKYTHGQRLYSMPDSRVRPTNFRLSNMATTVHLHHHYHHHHHSPTHSQTQLQMPAYKVEYSSRDELKPCPPAVGSFSTQTLNHSPTEVDFAGAEEDSDNQLSMTWISQPASESFLIGTVTYTNASQAGVSKHRDSSLSFKGAAYVNSVRSTNRGPSSTLLAMASQRPLSSQNGVEHLSHSLSLSAQNNIIMPLTKPEKAQTRTNKLGHLLTRRKKSNEWRTHASNTIGLVNTNGIY